MYDPVLCPFCKAKPIVLPQNPSVEGDAWGKVLCINEECVTWTGHVFGIWSGGLVIDDGESVIASGVDYRAKAVKRWNDAIQNLSRS